MKILPHLFLILILTSCNRQKVPVTYSIEELARIAMPAIAHLETDSGTGTGFLLEDQGW